MLFFFGIIYVPMYYLLAYEPTCLRNYNGRFIALFIAKLSKYTYLATYVPTYLRTYLPTYLRTYVPILSTYILWYYIRTYA
jgi:hypothetical protein